MKQPPESDDDEDDVCKAESSSYLLYYGLLEQGNQRVCPRNVDVDLTGGDMIETLLYVIKADHASCSLSSFVKGYFMSMVDTMNPSAGAVWPREQFPSRLSAYVCHLCLERPHRPLLRLYTINSGGGAGNTVRLLPATQTFLSLQYRKREDGSVFCSSAASPRAD